jgi:hypothetical protein
VGTGFSDKRSCLTRKQRKAARCRDAKNDEAKPLAVDVAGEKRRDGKTNGDAGQEDRRADKVGHAEQSECRKDGNSAHSGVIHPSIVILLS